MHVPLQSGADRVLRAMRRPYTTGMYRALIERLVAAVPGLGLGTDLITGFPGETAAEFGATEALVEALPFSYLHVFSYSDRRGTEAARLPVERVPPREVRERTLRLRALGDRKRRAFGEAHVGRVAEVLVLGERDRRSGALVGLTDDYLEIAFDGPGELMRGFARVTVTDGGGGRARGVLVRHDDRPGPAPGGRPPGGGPS
jgi:threonylcarbamoyladenosine tRNA methylthiotransferase MtaB